MCDPSTFGTVLAGNAIVPGSGVETVVVRADGFENGVVRTVAIDLGGGAT